MNKTATTAKILIILMVTIVLGGCIGARKLSFPGVYRIDIPQGNVITQEKVDQLRPGLSKRQVSFILGNPLIRDTFHQDRWDYVFRMKRGNGNETQSRLTVYFENGVMVDYDGDYTQTPENDEFGKLTPSEEPETAEASVPIEVVSQ